jgi:flavin reductase (DIM6/NTAB) family NADH-FMN oxidoreductase RutF
MTPETKEALSTVLGRIPSGVFILVAGDGNGQQTGLLASWIQQASFEPPQVTVAVNKSRYLTEWLTTGSPVTLNQIAKGDNSLFRHFGRGFEPGAEAFSGLETSSGRSGLPVLTSALCSLEGEISGRLEAGDHVIFLVTLTAAMTHSSAGAEPFVHLRRNGMSY